MNSPCAPSSWRSILLGEQASLNAAFRRGPTLHSKRARLLASTEKRFLWLIITAFLLLTSSPALLAQTNDSAATVRGRVTDTAGAALIGASVTLGNLATGLERVVITDANGNFAFAASSGARYRLIVSAVGFAPISREVESHGSFDFTLEPSALAEKITVFSGSRQEELRESLNTKVDVIGRNRIRDTGYESVAEVLQELPGVVTRRGTQGAGAAGGEEGDLESYVDEDAQNFNLAGDWQISGRTAMQARGYFTRFDEITNSFLSPSGAAVQPGNLFERLGKVDASFTRIQGERQFIQGGAEWLTNTYGGVNRLQNDKGNDIDFASVWAQDRVSFAICACPGRVTRDSDFAPICAGLSSANGSIRMQASIQRPAY